MSTTLQALDLSNSPLLADTLRRGAPEVLKRVPKGDRIALLNWIYESALSRQPTVEERTIAAEILGSPPTPQGAEDLLWSVIMLPEFQIIR
jgi:hypothetical protein